MSATVQEIQSSPVSARDTGFPEPLSSERNTTLPHPDADTSKNASISAPDVALSRTNSRRSIRIPGMHSRKPSKHGTVVNVDGSIVHEKDMYKDIVYADGGESGGNANNAGNEDGIGGSEEEEHGKDDHEHKSGERKKGVLRKKLLHKV